MSPVGDAAVGATVDGEDFIASANAGLRGFVRDTVHAVGGGLDGEEGNAAGLAADDVVEVRNLVGERDREQESQHAVTEDGTLDGHSLVAAANEVLAGRLILHSACASLLLRRTWAE